MATSDVDVICEVAKEVKEADTVVEHLEKDILDQPEVSDSDSQLQNLGLKVFHDAQTNGGISADHLTQVSKQKRRVYFPEDGTIVSGYMDPPSPWNESATCSTEDLILAYRQACDKFGVKPMAKLCQQLQAINDFCDRNETLTLKGERLDYRHCETLEEVLRRVQFRTLDLESTGLEDEGAVALFDMVEHYQSCTRLNISNNRGIGIRGWQACARLMKKTPCLENLEARNCSITEQVMPFFCRSLRMGAQLTALHLENSVMSGRPLIVLVTALKMNDILRELYLADNRLMPSDGIQLGGLLRYNFRLQLLDVRNNHLQDVGTCHISEGIWEQNLGQGLATLVLWNNQVTYQSLTTMGRALMNTKSLETLNLGHNNITNEGIHRLKEGLLQNKSLLRIGLQAAKISCEGAVALAEFIAESPRLMRIDLRENDIKTGGLMALSLSLKVSESVTRIDLDKEPKRESSMRDYADQQRRLLNDISNYMQRNRDLARQREAEEELRKQQLELAQEEFVVHVEETPNDIAAENPEEQFRDLETSSKNSEDVEMVNDEGSPKRPLNLRLPFVGGSRTLDSPGFLTQANLPYIPGEGIVVGEGAQAVDFRDIPLEFPPSPMVSGRGHTVLAPILQNPPISLSPTTVLPNTAINNLSLSAGKQSSSQEILRSSPSSSPTAKRKFVISRVAEGSNKPTEGTKNSNESPELPMNPLYNYYNNICDKEQLATGVLPAALTVTPESVVPPSTDGAGLIVDQTSNATQDKEFSQSVNNTSESFAQNLPDLETNAALLIDKGSADISSDISNVQANIKVVAESNARAEAAHGPVEGALNNEVKGDASDSLASPKDPNEHGGMMDMNPLSDNADAIPTLQNSAQDTAFESNIPQGGVIKSNDTEVKDEAKVSDQERDADENITCAEDKPENNTVETSEESTGEGLCKSESEDHKNEHLQDLESNRIKAGEERDAVLVSDASGSPDHIDHDIGMDLASDEVGASDAESGIEACLEPSEASQKAAESCQTNPDLYPDQQGTDDEALISHSLVAGASPKIKDIDSSLGANGVNLDISNVLENLDKVDLMGLDLDQESSLGNRDSGVESASGVSDDFLQELEAVLAGTTEALSSTTQA